jgi:Fur family ferric uptake transcriptional regulator
MNFHITQKSEQLLSSFKIRKTDARIAILGILTGAGKPQTAEQIALKLAAKAPDKVTIYRTLECFVKAGFVHKAYLEARKWHFELADHCTEQRCHPHFVCKSCGRTRCMPEVSSPTVKVTRKGFVVHRQQIKLEGLCPSCSTKGLKIS